MTNQLSLILIFYEEIYYKTSQLCSATESLRQLLRAPGHLDGLPGPSGLLGGVCDPGHGAGHPRGDAHLGSALKNFNCKKLVFEMQTYIPTWTTSRK